MIALLCFCGGLLVGHVWLPILSDAVDRRLIKRWNAKATSGDYPPVHIRVAMKRLGA